MHNGVVGIATSLLLIACTGTATGPTGNGTVLIESDRTEYTSGDTAQFTIENVGATRVEFHPCPFVLERRLGGRWVNFDNDQNMICDSMQRVLDPGAKKVLLQRALPDVPGGTYRYRFDFVYEYGAERLPLASRVSNQFEII